MKTEESGFTLLEVVVALVIAGVALGCMFGVLSTGMQAITRAWLHGEGVSRAQSHLEALRAASRLVPGTTEGDDGQGYRWKISITPLKTAPHSNKAMNALMLVHVVIVSPQGREVAQLSGWQVSPYRRAGQ